MKCYWLFLRFFSREGQACSAWHHAKCGGPPELRPVVSHRGVPQPRHQAGRQDHEDPPLPRLTKECQEALWAGPQVTEEQPPPLHQWVQGARGRDWVTDAERRMRVFEGGCSTRCPKASSALSNSQEHTEDSSGCFRLFAKRCTRCYCSF